MKWIVNR